MLLLLQLEPALWQPWQGEWQRRECNCCFCWVTTWSQLLLLLLLFVPVLLFCLRRKTLCFCTKPTISGPPPPTPPPSALCAQRMLRFARICCNFSLSANAFAGKFWLNAPREFTLLGPFRVTTAVYFALPPALPLSLFHCLFLALPLSFEFDKWRSWRGDMLCNLGICFSPRGEKKKVLPNCLHIFVINGRSRRAWRKSIRSTSNGRAPLLLSTRIRIRIADVCCRRRCCKNKEADKENPIKLQHSTRERERARRSRRETATASITSCNNNFAPINQR